MNKTTSTLFRNQKGSTVDACYDPRSHALCHALCSPIYYFNDHSELKCIFPSPPIVAIAEAKAWVTYWSILQVIAAHVKSNRR